MKATIEDWIRDMEASNGPIAGVAALAQTLKLAMRDSRNWQGMPPEAKELLEQTATLIARILNGDASDPSHWNGAAACLRLRALALKGNNEATTAAESVEAGISKLALRVRSIPPAPTPPDGAA